TIGLSEIDGHRRGYFIYQTPKRYVLGGKKHEIGIVGRCRVGCARVSGAGIGPGREDRYSKRSVRRLCRLRWKIFAGSGEDGDRGFRRRGAWTEDRAHHGRSSEQA